MEEANLIGAVDQGTSSSRFIVFEAQTGQVVAQHQAEVEQLFPHESWVEQDPKALLKSVEDCIEAVCSKLKENKINLDRIKGIGITNQRESTIVWDKITGDPLYNAVVWCDARNGAQVETLQEQFGQDHLREKCGLPISTYFSATKLSWLLDNIPQIRKAIEQDRLMFGTVDTWLIWNLTGGVQGGKHLTDVTNASRTMLMNLSTLDWDCELLEFFHLPGSILPKIQASSSNYGSLTSGPLLGLNILGVLGDQQASLLGHGCTRTGEAKNTYGTGCFLLYNTGEDIVHSSHGLLTTVAYQEEGQPPKYALEGSIAVAGAALRWLRDNMGMIKDFSEASILASQVEKTDGVYFVPAFSGLFAPHWRSDARGTLCGLTGHTTRQHVARAVLESVCFQVCEIYSAMKADSGCSPHQLLVDGGMTESDLLLQLQANLLGGDVARPDMKEVIIFCSMLLLVCISIQVTALGAAVAAGVTAGVWKLGYKMQNLTIFSSQTDKKERNRKLKRWKMAIERSLGWDMTSDAAK